MVELLAFHPLFEKGKKSGRKRVLGKLRNKCGVYLIKENGVIVYIGMSGSCVVEALYRHFYIWQDRRSRVERITYEDRLSENHYEALIIETNKEQAHKLERALIFSMEPRDNKQRYQQCLDELTSNNNVEISEPDENSTVILRKHDDRSEHPF